MASRLQLIKPWKLNAIRQSLAGSSDGSCLPASIPCGFPVSAFEDSKAVSPRDLVMHGQRIGSDVFGDVPCRGPVGFNIEIAHSRLR